MKENLNKHKKNEELYEAFDIEEKEVKTHKYYSKKILKKIYI